jgi:hypothetical protein
MGILRRFSGTLALIPGPSEDLGYRVGCLRALNAPVHGWFVRLAYSLSALENVAGPALCVACVVVQSLDEGLVALVGRMEAARLGDSIRKAELKLFEELDT